VELGREARLVFRFGDHAFDAERRDWRCRTELVAFDPQVFDLLVYLVHHRGRVASNNNLIDGVSVGRIVSEPTLTSWRSLRP
jgi:DNA-binding winged helix-turn-helix (wHTH) protein